MGLEASGISPREGVERQTHLLWDVNDETSVLIVSITASPGDPFSPRGPFSGKKKQRKLIMYGERVTL